MKQILSLILLISFHSSLVAQSPILLKGLGNQEINCISNLPDGSIAATGFFNNELICNTSIYQFSALGLNDAFVLKLDSNQSVSWAYHIEGIANEYGNTLVSDPIGNIYLAGIFENNTRIYHANGYDSLSSFGDFDFFVAKYSPQGQLIWLKQLGGPFKELSPYLHYGQDHHLYLSGNFEGTVDFDWGTGTVLKSNDGPQDNFILKFDTNGTFNWVHQIEGRGYQYAGGISVNSKGEIYTAATFSDTIDINAQGASQVLISNGGVDVLFLKLDSNGQVIWGNQIGSAGVDIGIDVAHDDNDNCYLVASFSNTVDADILASSYFLQSNGDRDILLAKYSELDSLIWAHGFGGPSIDIVTQVELNDDQSICFTGRFQGGVDFDPSTNQQLRNSQGSSDGFICELDSAGNFNDLWTIGGPSADFCNSISTSYSRLSVGGSFVDSASYALNNNNYKLISSGSKDAFLLNFSSLQTGILQEESKNFASIFPNPSEQKIQIKIKAEELPIAGQVYNSKGSLIKEFSLTNTLQTIDLPAEAGTYFISLRNNRSRQMIPVIKLP